LALTVTETTSHHQGMRDVPRHQFGDNRTVLIHHENEKNASAILMRTLQNPAVEASRSATQFQNIQGCGGGVVRGITSYSTLFVR
jgi:hypothetical protein